MPENELKKRLLERIDRCNKIIEGLEGNPAFQLLIEDFKATTKKLDDNWQWITDEKTLKEAQITKMATLSVINTIENYKHDLKMAQGELFKLEHPDQIIQKDYDNE